MTPKLMTFAILDAKQDGESQQSTKDIQWTLSILLPNALARKSPQN